MKDITTQFAGLKLRNPIIVSSSGLTDTPEKNKRLAEYGAGAIVLKSLFEEQIQMDAQQINQNFEHTEGADYFMSYFQGHKVADYLQLIKKSKEVCNIPIIASINCSEASSWVSFAKEIEKAGADALEINVLALQTKEDEPYGTFEEKHITILQQIKENTKLPIIMKLGKNITNPIALIKKLKTQGAAGIVLFNRFYQPDIDINAIKQIGGEVFSHPSDLADGLRWTAIASAKTDINIALSGGVSTPESIIKAILSGANCIEMCSVIYQKGPNYLKTLIRFLQEWMEEKEYENINQFIGLLNLKQTKGINAFERTQFLKYFADKKA